MGLIFHYHITSARQADHGMYYMLYHVPLIFVHYGNHL